MDISKSQLTISHLKMICQLETCETVKEAAQALFITQPALTNRIREAEKRLNTQLFYRRGRRIYMSNAGKRLLVSAKKILQELARAEHDISRLTHGVEQVLRMSMPHYASFAWLPEVLKGFALVYPQIELEITSQQPVKPLQALYNHDVDLAILSSSKDSLEVDAEQYVSKLITQDELVACLSIKHEKSRQAFLSPEDFTDQTYVTNSTVVETEREYELFFKPAGVIPSKVLQVGFNDAILALVQANVGVSIFSKRQLSRYLPDSSLATCQLGPDGLPVYWHLVYRKHEYIIEPAEQLFLLLCQQHK
ncbi:LysR family transcriptional regulator [Thalassotalea sediminis]|uniref:LysR family transcriptional regulator n=1 Tax=Thalassotalea sediminis TaxID=1759089 RepID=UPI002573E25E|nr:LysR family transcriptional regulator [Thalassotalea sediminis]